MLATLRLPLDQPANRGGSQADALTLIRLIPLQLKRRGVELRMVLAGETSAAARVDLSLLRAVARSRRWVRNLICGRAGAVRELARQENIDARSLRRLLPLGFLSPRIVEAIAEGRQPPDLTIAHFIHHTDLPLLWRAQRDLLGIG